MVLQSPDGAWRVEVAQRGSRHGYRLLNEARDIEMDWLGITTLERILAENGISMADLVEVDGDERSTGAA
jgi:hypothetical protein